MNKATYKALNNGHAKMQFGASTLAERRHAKLTEGIERLRLNKFCDLHARRRVA